MKKSILVTGGTGFIGRHLVKKLLAEDSCSIFCLVRNIKNASFLKNAGASLILANITDVTSLGAFENLPIDTVIHCAACVDEHNPDILYKVNVEGTENICRLCLRMKVRQLIYISSVAVISGNEEALLKDNMPYKATNAYGESKIEAEKKVIEYREKGLSAVILRPPPVYGEDEPHMMKTLLFLIKYRMLPLLYGGSNIFHLGYIENIVAAIIFAMDNDEFLEGTFMVADEETLTAAEVFRILSQAIGAKPPVMIPDWLSNLLAHSPYMRKKFRIAKSNQKKSRFYLKDRLYSITRIQSLGFNPPYPARTSLSKSAKELYYAKK